MFNWLLSALRAPTRNLCVAACAACGARHGLAQESAELFSAPQPPYELTADLGYELPPLAEHRCRPDRPSLLSEIVADHQHFYDAHTMGWLAAGVGAHAVISNTNIDEFLREEYQQNIRNADTDEWSEVFHMSKFFGEGTYVLPIYAATALAGIPFNENTVLGQTGQWGERSIRTVLVGAPPLLVLQSFIGASRPGEKHSESHWEPFQDDNGVSGHAFMGAVPFLSAAKMAEHRSVKALLYVGSAMPAISRVNDDAHYTSQAILGWSIAYLAANAVDDTYDAERLPQVFPGPVGAEGNGVNVLWRY
ncbi:PAP2 superfamily protein [Posidoniimonas polymericola]|uniref:PAP2 superfamily protein n=1 Tax=Posidoniimonas polymericola TaxID=2528002 RepID=A0A5C5ZFI7_9BACT|nr:phosphatase PAP2 family protein [Posidoniimonas polymericola]TWT85787.1 PAP2 superfamily protein [Posidoniimonas polymericola]